MSPRLQALTPARHGEGRPWPRQQQSLNANRYRRAPLHAPLSCTRPCTRPAELWQRHSQRLPSSPVLPKR